MHGQKLLLDVSTGSGLGVVNHLPIDKTLLLNVLIIAGRIIIEMIQARREKRKKAKAESQK